jgi:alpha-galactosidase
MSLWALLAAPLLAGNDLSKMTDETKSILMNKRVIAIDQDALGVQGNRIDQTKGDAWEIWSKPLSAGAVAVGLFNRSSVVTTMSVKLSDIGIASPSSITDIWSGKKLVPKDGIVEATVPVHGVVLFNVEP